MIYNGLLGCHFPISLTFPVKKVESLVWFPGSKSNISGSFQDPQGRQPTGLFSSAFPFTEEMA